jgi:EF hand
MFRPWLLVLAIVAAVFLARDMVVKAGPAQGEKTTGVVSSTPGIEKAERERKFAAATDAAKELLLAIDTDKSGRVSKQEWMKFMEAEFDRLDTDHTGHLNVKELTLSRVRVRPFVGK